MASRKDQLHSYQFMMQRVISSVMLHETDPEQTPLRRGVGAVFGGVMLTGLLAIAFGVYGVISGNIGDRWQQEGALVIEKETGAHFIYEGGVLQPVLNYTSARLLAQDPTAVHRVPGRNLAGIVRRAPVGIPGAPASLPPPGRVLGPPWTICSAQGIDDADAPVTTTVLVVGESVPAAAGLGQRGLLVRDSEDQTPYLIWRSYRYRIGGDSPGQVIQSLYGGRVVVEEVGTGWLNALPAGPDIAPIEIDGFGEPSGAVEGRDIGGVLHHPVTGGEQAYLVLDDGLAPLTQLQVLLLAGQYEVELTEVTAAEASSAPASDALAPAADDAAALPAAPPELIALAPGSRPSICAETSDGRAPPLVTITDDLSAAVQAVATSVQSPEGIRYADWVLVQPGHVAVVRALPSEEADIGAFHIVTDTGVRHPVPTAEVLTQLGYSASIAVEMPAALVQRIPVGPTLDPALARLPAPIAQ